MPHNFLQPIENIESIKNVDMKGENQLSSIFPLIRVINGTNNDRKKLQFIGKWQEVSRKLIEIVALSFYFLSVRVKKPKLNTNYEVLC